LRVSDFFIVPAIKREACQPETLGNLPHFPKLTLQLHCNALRLHGLEKSLGGEKVRFSSNVPFSVVGVRRAVDGGTMRNRVMINWQPETVKLCEKLERMAPGTISEQSHRIGRTEGEPLLVCLDGVLRYAKAYRKHFDGPLSEDGFLGPAWLKVAMGLRELLNGDGAVAMETGRTTDSKDNGTADGIFMAALKAAGFGEEVL
jgi:hypothetical protein